MSISKFGHFVHRLLVSSEFTKRLSKEVLQWIRETKAGNQGKPNTISWKSWNTNVVASKVSGFLSPRLNCLGHARWLLVDLTNPLHVAAQTQ